MVFLQQQKLNKTMEKNGIFQQQQKSQISNYGTRRRPFSCLKVTKLKQYKFFKNIVFIVIDVGSANRTDILAPPNFAKK